MNDERPQKTIGDQDRQPGIGDSAGWGGGVMEKALFYTRYLLPVLCIAGAIFLAYLDKTGWGWLIFAALVTNHQGVGDIKPERLISRFSSQKQSRNS